ncbi:MAG: DUF134 domain-containing protein [Candidatus Ranarchaeia archaeon]
MHHHRRGRSRGICRGRPQKPVILRKKHVERKFQPKSSKNTHSIHLNFAELETLRLVDLENLTQEEAGEMMNISRGTIWRLLQTARRKTAKALTEGIPIHIQENTYEK